MRFAEIPVSIPEADKKPGLCYAATNSGIELPIINVGHPSFRIEKSDMTADPKQIRKPSFLQRLLIKPMLRGSLLAKAVSEARGTYAGGIGTYLLKLGPENLGRGYAKKIDRAIASSLPCLSARVRLETTARLLADAAAESFSSDKNRNRLFLCNIAGGPASDSLNALMILRRERPGLLERTGVELRLMDLNSDGTDFAGRSLRALTMEGCPLAGLNVRLKAYRYDWNDPSELKSILGDLDGIRDAVAVSSEGGLFEYASDEAIRDTLETLRSIAPVGTSFIGSVGKAGARERAFHEAIGASTVLRPLESFREIVETAGWRTREVRECPLCYCVALKAENGK